MSEIVCPRCNSDAVQSVPVAFDSQTISVTGSGQDYAASRSRLASRLAPPARPETGCAGEILLGLIAAYLLNGAYVFLFHDWGVWRSILSPIHLLFRLIDVVAEMYFNLRLLILLGLYVILPILAVMLLYKSPDLSRYQQELERWQASFFCHKCGELFIPGSTRGSGE